MKQRLAIAVLFALVAGTAGAEPPPAFQAALHGGYRFGGSLEDAETGDDRDFDDSESFALALELRYGKGDDRFYQLWYSRQATEVGEEPADFDADVEYLHVGGTLPFGGWERAQPYFAAGLGVTRFSSSEPDTDDRTRFSGSAALGLELPIGERAGIRLEARGYLTAVDTDSALFCEVDNGEGVCRIVASGSSLFQTEILAGILVRF
jgi:opacity protein-like surface antigen